MSEKDHKKWSDLVSFGTSVRREDAIDSFDFKTSDSGDEAAFDVADVLVTSVQTRGAGSGDTDVLPEPEPVSDFGMTDHFDFM
jgi:hypothetical protein